MSQRSSTEADDINKDDGGVVSVQNVVSLTQAREQRLEKKRRKTERVLIKNFIAAYSVVDLGQIQPIELIDVSEEGCAFQVPFNLKKPLSWPNQTDQFPIRLYFSQESYLEIHVQIVRSNPIYENESSYVRFGCSIDKTLSSYVAYSQFVKFLKLYGEHSKETQSERRKAR